MKEEEEEEEGGDVFQQHHDDGRHQPRHHALHGAVRGRRRRRRQQEGGGRLQGAPEAGLQDGLQDVLPVRRRRRRRRRRRKREIEVSFVTLTVQLGKARPDIPPSIHGKTFLVAMSHRETLHLPDRRVAHNFFLCRETQTET